MNATIGTGTERLKTLGMEPLATSCCIVGGGPAGVMLGFLLARGGVDVLVLEKHKDFFRDFRGDTIHPSTLELMHELGLLDEFLRLPHQRVDGIRAYFGEQAIHLADFNRLRARCPFIALVPQWDFLNFISGHARRLPNFRLRMESEAVDLIIDNGRVAGVKVKTPAGQLDVRADLVVGADGRGSTVRERGGLEVVDSGAPIDVLWFRLAKKDGDPAQAFGFVSTGQFMVLIDRGDYWQCAYVIRKGAFPEIKQRGLESFRANVKRCAVFLGDRVHDVKQLEDVSLLAVKVDHLRQWHREGLLCIGDAAHAMSPVGGVGINLAIQDAVAAANILAEKLREGAVTTIDLQAVQQRRERPARLTQKVQIFLHEHLLEPIFDARQPIQPPLPMRLLERYPRLRKYPARMIGMGFRPEHLKTKEAAITR